MGCGASSAGGAKKAKAAPAVVGKMAMKKTKIEEFQSFFDRTKAPSDTVVKLTNLLNEVSGAVKMASAALTGGVNVAVTVDGGFKVTKFGNDEKEVEVKEASGCVSMSGEVDAEMSKAFEAATTASKDLNATAPPGMSFQIAFGFVSFDPAVSDDGVVSDSDKKTLEAVEAFNAAVAALRKSALGSVTLKNAITELKKKLQAKLEEMKDQCKNDPSSTLKFVATAPEFSDLSLTINDDLRPFLPLPVKLMWEACERLAKALQEIFAEVQKITPQVKELMEECKAIPGKAQDAVQKAGLSMMDGLTEVKVIKGNCGEFSKVPGQLTALCTAAQGVVAELSGALSGNS